MLTASLPTFDLTLSFFSTTPINLKQHAWPAPRFALAPCASRQSLLHPRPQHPRHVRPSSCFGRQHRSALSPDTFLRAFLTGHDWIRLSRRDRCRKCVHLILAARGRCSPYPLSPRNQHEHNIVGGSQFSQNYDYDRALTSQCTTAPVNIDFCSCTSGSDFPFTHD